MDLVIREDHSDINWPLIESDLPQDEAHPHTHVPFFGHELWAIQEDEIFVSLVTSCAMFAC